MVLTIGLTTSCLQICKQQTGSVQAVWCNLIRLHFALNCVCFVLCVCLMKSRMILHQILHKFLLTFCSVLCCAAMAKHDPSDSGVVSGEQWSQSLEAHSRNSRSSRKVNGDVLFMSREIAWPIPSESSVPFVCV